jgi:hypothetical protein
MKEYGLGRQKQFDERSRQYPVMATVDKSFPRSYTWRCDVVLDQGREGACVGFALAHELAARPKVFTGITNSEGLRIYHAAQKIDPWPGGAYPGASPRYDGTSVLAGVKILAREGKIAEYRWAFGVDDLAVAVSRKGPAVLGVPWYSGMYEPRDGKLVIEGSVVGGHAILCHSFNAKRREFKVHNSWGPDWGKEGEAVVSWETMSRLLAEDGEAVIPMVRKFQQD